MSTTTIPSFDELADAVVADGVAAHADTLTTLAAAAYSAGVSRQLITLLTDRSQPEVARMRALGRVLAQLDSPSEPQVRTSIAAA
jgi:hypothetical protein